MKKITERRNVDACHDKAVELGFADEGVSKTPEKQKSKMKCTGPINYELCVSMSAVKQADAKPMQSP